MKKFLLAALTAALFCNVSFAGSPAIEPDGTYLFAIKDSTELYFDIYEPAKGSETSIDGVEKPTILFVFGGGFVTGSRSESSSWYKVLTDNGYRVIAGDYRLGLKGVSGAGVNMKFINHLDRAITMAVDDLFSLTAFIIENADELGVDTKNIVAAGSSAGAITVMQAEWEISNRSSLAAALPEGFNYAGIISFSGAIFSRHGAIRYKNEPCPTMMLHGTADKVVPYDRIAVLNLRFCGCNSMTKVFEKNGYSYTTYRFEGNTHEIAGSMVHNFPKEKEFLEQNIMKGLRSRKDVLLNDPEIKVPENAGDFKSLYN